MEKLKRIILIILISTPFLFGQNAEPAVHIDQLINELEAEFFIDLYRDSGLLKHGEHTVAFSPELPFIIIDYNFLLPAPGINLDENGIFLFSPEAADAVRNGLSGKYQAGNHIIKAVILDPGHGGRDPGAVGRFTVDGEVVKYFEKDVVLTLGKEIYGHLKRDFPERDIILTRSDDTYLTLEERTEIANAVKLEKNEAMIFVSLHANASFNTKATGFEIWYLPSDYRRNLLSPGDVEGADEQVIPILNTMLEEEFTKESISLARQIMDGMSKSLGERALNRGLKEESWFVVRNAEMPSVLIEIGFISNKEEALRLQDPSYLQDMAQGIYNGIRTFIDGYENSKGFTE